VFGARAGQAVREARAAPPARRSAPVARLQETRGCQPAEVAAVVERIHSAAWIHLGIERAAGGIREALRLIGGSLDVMPAAARAGAPLDRAGLEAANMASVALLVARAALAREESRGAHHRTDHPERDDARFGRSFGIAGQEPPRPMDGAIALVETGPARDGAVR